MRTCRGEVPIVGSIGRPTRRAARVAVTTVHGRSCVPSVVFCKPQVSSVTEGFCGNLDLDWRLRARASDLRLFLPSPRRTPQSREDGRRDGAPGWMSRLGCGAASGRRIQWLSPSSHTAMSSPPRKTRSVRAGAMPGRPSSATSRAVRCSWTVTSGPAAAPSESRRSPACTLRVDSPDAVVSVRALLLVVGCRDRPARLPTAGWWRRLSRSPTARRVVPRSLDQRGRRSRDVGFGAPAAQGQPQRRQCPVGVHPHGGQDG